MAVGGRLPVMQAVRMAYRDVYRAYRAMPVLLLIALTVTLAGVFLQLYVLKPASPGTALGELVSLLVGAVQNFFLTPVLIAIHRFILMDEVTPRYELAFQTARFQRFFTWSVALFALSSASTLIAELLALAGLASLTSASLQFVLAVMILFISLRLTILFPAIAIDAPSADPAKAFADTKGHAWGIFLIGLVAVLPLVAVVIVVAVVAFLVAGHPADAALSTAVSITSGLLVGLIVMPLFVAIASRIFQALADRVLARDAPGAPATG
jgi:hypothetical protein